MTTSARHQSTCWLEAITIGAGWRPSLVGWRPSLLLHQRDTKAHGAIFGSRQALAAIGYRLSYSTQLSSLRSPGRGAAKDRNPLPFLLLGDLPLAMASIRLQPNSIGLQPSGNGLQQHKSVSQKVLWAPPW